MEPSTAKASSNENTLKPEEATSPFSISPAEFQKELDRLIDANPGLDDAAVSCPEWMDRRENRGQGTRAPRGVKSMARGLANFWARPWFR